METGGISCSTFFPGSGQETGEWIRTSICHSDPGFVAGILSSSQGIFCRPQEQQPVIPDEQITPFCPYYLHPGCHGIPGRVHE
jgi:hypothetical protein